MKLLGGILIVVSLVVASISASVAYHISVDRPDDQIVGLTLLDPQDLVWLSGDHGAETVAEAKGVPDTQKRLTPERIERLRDRASQSASRSARYVRVREFSFARWPAKWTFLLAWVGMVAGALLQRRSALPGAGKHPSESAVTPLEALKGVMGKLDEILRLANGPTVDEETRRRIILAGADELQKEQLPAFVEVYPRMVAELGMGHAAEVMDLFSGAERLINRAWSAACDGVVDEAMHSIVQARQTLDAIKLAPG